MDLILPIFTGVLVLALIAWWIFGPKKPSTEEDRIHRHAPLTVPPERAALGVQALLRRERNLSYDRYEQVTDLEFRPGGERLAGNSNHRLTFWNPEDGGILVVVIVFLVRWLGGATTKGSPTAPPAETALDILKKRFARGPIKKRDTVHWATPYACRF